MDISGIKHPWRRFLAWQYAGLCLLVLIALVLHVVALSQPSSPVFDEKFYTADARYILEGEGSARIEHPPLGKLLIAGGVALFGDNPFGWRLLPVLFGLAGVVLFYFICRWLKLSPRASFLAAFILAFENLSFVQGGIGMLDVFSLTFILAAFALYLKNRFYLAGLAVALAALCKITGALALPVIILHWWFSGRERPGRLIPAMALAPVCFLILMPVFDLAIWHKLTNPFESLGVMFRLYDATFAAYPSPMLSRPWEWLLRPEIITYWVDPHYVGMISPDLWLLIIPVMLFTAYLAARNKSAAMFSLAWFACLYIAWIPYDLVTDRITYVYYFYPAVGAVCLGAAIWADTVFGAARGIKYRLEKFGIPLFVLLHLAAFAVLAPVPYAWKVPGCALV